MSNHKEAKTIALAMVLVLLLSAFLVCGQPASCFAAEVNPIKLALSLSIIEMNDRWTKVMKPWAESIQNESKGRIVIQLYFVGTLAKEQQNYQGLVDGLIDLSYASLSPSGGVSP